MRESNTHYTQEVLHLLTLYNFLCCFFFSLLAGLLHQLSVFVYVPSVYIGARARTHATVAEKRQTGSGAAGDILFSLVLLL